MSNWQEKNNQSCSYNFAFQKKRCKADWAGLSIGDAFKNDLDYYQRLPAQRVFYQLVDNAQKRVVEAMGVYSSGETQFMVKPQISPCYTNYPANLAAHSAIGLTAYLEFTARCEHSLLLTHMAEYLQDPATLDNASVDRATYARIARLVAETVQQRLVLEELSRVCILPSVEIHRLFGSSQQRLNFRTIKEVVQAVVLFGDVLPPWEPMNLHPLTRVIIRALERISGEYLDGLPQCQPQRFIYLGEAWVRRICKTLTAYLPLPRPEQAQGRTEKKLSMPEFLRSQADATSPARLEHSKPPTQTPEGLAPLEGPMPPSLGETGNAAQHVTNRLQMPGNGGDDGGGGQSALDEESQKALAEFSEAMDQAGGQSRDWEDMRSEIVESAMAQTAFQQGPITGSPTDGNEVIVNLPSGEFAGGRIFDRPLGLTNDSQAVENLKIQARPVTEQLRRNLYPSLDHRPQTLRLRTGGVLDGGRLALAGFCPAVFKRFRNVEMADNEASLDYNKMTRWTWIREGKKYMSKHAQTLEEARKNYGVDPGVITAIIMVETKFGRYLGKRSIVTHPVHNGRPHRPGTARIHMGAASQKTSLQPGPLRPESRQQIGLGLQGTQGIFAIHPSFTASTRSALWVPMPAPWASPSSCPATSWPTGRTATATAASTCLTMPMPFTASPTTSSTTDGNPA